MKKKLRVLFLTVEVLTLTAFLIPISRGIVNIGNVTGMTIIALLGVYTLHFNAINKQIKALWKSKIGRMLVLTVTFVISIIALLAVILTALMISANFKAPAENSTAVILGCRVYGERASLMLRERMDAAYAYLIENPEAACVLSGGMGEGETISEAECMFRYLTKKGISPDRLYKEECSTSTRENLLFSFELIKSNGLETSIAVVTNEFHEYRAGKIAGRMNITYGSVPAKTAWWLFPTYYIRELYGILYEIVF